MYIDERSLIVFLKILSIPALCFDSWILRFQLYFLTLDFQCLIMTCYIINAESLCLDKLWCWSQRLLCWSSMNFGPISTVTVLWFPSSRGGSLAALLSLTLFKFDHAHFSVLHEIWGHLQCWQITISPVGLWMHFLPSVVYFVEQLTSQVGIPVTCIPWSNKYLFFFFQLINQQGCQLLLVGMQ